MSVYQKTIFSCYFHFYEVNLCDGLECVYVEYKSGASTACELPD